MSLTTRSNIAFKTGLGKSTITRFIKKHISNKDKVEMSHPSKLTPYDKRLFVHHILTGQAANVT
ncbi:hypothetical protein AZE42_12737 [Rhizopogon vesiculosus]|uniref:Uncharacterized protein n=1 Tax=Rhizopogon vesiculosus TaxID=180088 RepID=A0A1J8R200_9AGAM|nr:hypothetical protein AZE42_12737 [Rhizopogon vesiculosus]